MKDSLFDKMLDHITSGDSNLYGTSEDEIHRILNEMTKMNPRTLTFSALLDALKLDDYEVSERRMVSSLYPLWVDKESMVNSEDNLLNSPDSSDWKSGYYHALAKYVAEKGLVVRLNPSYYGWMEYSEENKHGKIVFVSNVCEDEWDEFAGTFVDGEHCTGIIADVVFEDGYGAQVRAEEDLSTIIPKLLKG